MKTQEGAEVAVKPAEKELGLIEKVKLMSDLTGACQNKEVIHLLSGLPGGARIYELFVEAIEREVSLIMNGKSESAPKELNTALDVAKQLQTTLSNFRDTIVGFHNTALVEVLNMMNKNLGGKSAQFQSSHSEQQQTQQQTQQQNSSSGHRGRGEGIVSF